MKFVSLMLAAALSTAAQAKPAPEQVREVVDYYFNGRDAGVVLADFRVCDDVHAEGELKNECRGQRDPASLLEGDSVLMWMMFMVPSGVEPQDIMLQLNHQGMTLGLEKAKVASSMRYRVWRKVSFDRPGEWEARVMHDKGPGGLEVLREIKLNVQPKPQ